MDVYQISKERYHIDTFLATAGSESPAGRWSAQGQGILYTSRSPELALLELLGHFPLLRPADLPELWLTTIRLPEVEQAIFWIDPGRLPANWEVYPLSETQRLLTDWLTDPFSLAVAVPSSILSIAYNVLLHPDHPAFAQLEIISQERLRLGS